MEYGIYDKRHKHVLLAICYSRKSAEAWVETFNPSLWTDKTLSKDCLEIREFKAIFRKPNATID